MGWGGNTSVRRAVAARALARAATAAGSPTTGSNTMMATKHTATNTGTGSIRAPARPAAVATVASNVRSARKVPVALPWAASLVSRRRPSPTRARCCSASVTARPSAAKERNSESPSRVSISVCLASPRAPTSSLAGVPACRRASRTRTVAVIPNPKPITIASGQDNQAKNAVAAEDCRRRRQDRERAAQELVLDRVGVDGDPSEQLARAQLGCPMSGQHYGPGEQAGAQLADQVQRGFVGCDALPVACERAPPGQRLDPGAGIEERERAGHRGPGYRGCGQEPASKTEQPGPEPERHHGHRRRCGQPPRGQLHAQELAERSPSHEAAPTRRPPVRGQSWPRSSSTTRSHAASSAGEWVATMVVA